MKLGEIVDILHAEVVLNNGDNEPDVVMAYGSDLMSDVLTFAKPGAILLTGLTTPQAIFTAEMADVGVVCFVRGKRPPEDTVRLAQSKNMVLLRTDLSMFESCGRLYEHGLRGSLEHEER